MPWASSECVRPMETLIETGGELIHCYALNLLAEAYIKSREPEKGLAVVAEALKNLESSGQRLHEAEIWRPRDELIMMHGDRAGEAEDSFRHALDIAHFQQASSWELRNAARLSLFLHIDGRPEEARCILGPVIANISEGRQDSDFRDAAALLAKLD